MLGKKQEQEKIEEKKVKVDGAIEEVSDILEIMQQVSHAQQEFERLEEESVQESGIYLNIINKDTGKVTLKKIPIDFLVIEEHIESYDKLILAYNLDLKDCIKTVADNRVIK